MRLCIPPVACMDSGDGSLSWFSFFAVMAWMCSCMREREPENDTQTARLGNWSVGFSSEASTRIDRI